MSTPAGVTTTSKPVHPLGDESDRSSKRRKPTDSTLPTRFNPPNPTHSTTLNESLDQLNQLSSHYRELQRLEHRLDWTIARKRQELKDSDQQSNHNSTTLKRTLRLHVQVETKDQTNTFSNDELQREGQPVQAESQEGETTKVPRVEIKLTGEVLDDESQTSIPWTSHLSRLSVESSSLSQPLTWNRPTVPPPSSSSPSSSDPTSTTTATFPSTLTFTIPTSSSLSLRLSLLPYYPRGQERYTVIPELAQLLDCPESDRIGVVEKLWMYVREKNLIIEPTDQSSTAGGGKGGVSMGGGIKTDSRLRKFFQNQPVVPFHHVPEYVNRWLAPLMPRIVDLEIPVGSNEPSTLHLAYDTPLDVLSPFSQSVHSLTSKILQSPLNPSNDNNSSPSSSSSSEQLSTSLESLSSQIALSCFSVTQHTQQLQSLLSFTQDPISFLTTYLSNQRSGIERVLSSRGGGAGKGNMMEIGTGWKEDLRSKENWNGTWVEEAVGVWGMREHEAKMRRK